MSEGARLKSTIYVGGLDDTVSVRTLTEAFLPFGEIADISLPKQDVPSAQGQHRGFGYVEFELPADAKEAIDNMDQSELYGKVIKVAAAKPQKDSNEGLGSKNALWQQVSSICTLNIRGCLYLAKANDFHRKAIWQDTQSMKEILGLPIRERKR